jgi:hypothetical protein
VTTTAKPISAYLVHKIPGRARLRIPGRRRDTGFFQRVQDNLAHCPDVSLVEVAPATGSVLIFHQGGLDRVRRFARQHNLFELKSRESKPIPLGKRVSLQLGVMDKYVQHVSGGTLDISGIAFLIMGTASAFAFAAGDYGKATRFLLYGGVALLLQKPTEILATEAEELAMVVV